MLKNRYEWLAKALSPILPATSLLLLPALLAMEDGGEGEGGESGGESGGEGEGALGDGGKRAIEAERKAAKDAEKARRAAEKKAADLEARLSKFEEESKSEQDKALDAARKEAEKAARTEERSRADRRILSAELKAAAGTRLQNPADAVALLDLDEFTVDDDGEVDAKAIGKALDDLLAERPYLAANGQKPPPVDQGPRQTDTKPEVKPGMSRLRQAYADSAK